MTARQSTAVVVVSGPRCGSSAVAGALHHMGVCMGTHFQSADALNRRGYWEDLQWGRLARRIVGDKYTVAAVAMEEWHAALISGLIRKRARQHRLWGFKSPYWVFLLSQSWQLFEQEGVNTKVVRVNRHREHAARSLQRHSEIAYDGEFRMTLSEAEELQDEWQRAVERSLLEYSKVTHGPIHELRFEQLLADPPSVLRNLRGFVFDGEEMEQSIGAAIDFIEPNLVNFKTTSAGEGA